MSDTSIHWHIQGSPLMPKAPLVTGIRLLASTMIIWLNPKVAMADNHREGVETAPPYYQCAESACRSPPYRQCQGGTMV